MTPFWFAFIGTLILICALGSTFLLVYLLIVALCGYLDRLHERRNFISDYERRKYSITPELPFDWKPRKSHGRR